MSEVLFVEMIVTTRDGVCTQGVEIIAPEGRRADALCGTGSMLETVILERLSEGEPAKADVEAYQAGKKYLLSHPAYLKGA